MNIGKRAILPLLASGGMAAALFGGGAVHTAFTSSGSGTLSANTAKIGTAVSGNVALSNAVPGDLGPTSAVTVTNNGSTPETLAVSLAPTGNPSQNNTALDQYVEVYFNGAAIGNLATLEADYGTGHAATIPGANLAAGGSVSYKIALGLDQNAPNSVADSFTEAVFTVTGTATTDPASGNTAGGDNING